MFPYRAPLKPMLFSSSVAGRMFGQYGTWTVHYLANIRKAWTNATKAQRIAFATRWLGNSLALYAAFRTVGINAQNYLPWVPAQFTGGPLFHLAYNMVLSIGKGYPSRIARAEVDRLLPVNLLTGLVDGKEFFPSDWVRYIPAHITPGYNVLRSLVDAYRLFDEGDYVRGVWRFLSAPVVPD
jgi:hypothetical protein